MDKASKDILFTIAMDLDLPSLSIWCQSHSRISNLVCKNDDVWRSKLLKEYPDYERFNFYKSLKETYVFIYQLSLVKKLLNSQENLYDIFLRKEKSLIYEKLTDVPAFHLPNLQKICLGDNELTKVPAFDLPNLQRFYLHNNKLREVPTFNLPNLEIFYLQNNKLTKVPAFNLPKLQELYLYCNKLTELPAFDLPNLKKLILSRNKLTKVPVFNLPNLQRLDLDNNNLTEVPAFDYPKLQLLYLHKNKFIEEEKIKIKRKYVNKVML
jgi:Leucine-rich repeat (LRR) protein